MINPQNLLRQAQSLGFTLRDVARMVGVSPSAVSKWRQGVYPPDPRHATRFEEVRALLDGVTPELRNRLRNGKARRAWIRHQATKERM